jgi:hypothetical protein
MADPTVTSLEVQDGVLHIIGSNFTQTTTTVYVDDVTVAHSFVSATELTVDPAPMEGAEVVVDKGGATTAPQTVPVTGSVPEAPSAYELPAGGSTGNTGAIPIAPADLQTEQEKGPKDPVSLLTEPTPYAELGIVKVAPREPYPTGNPPDPYAQFERETRSIRTPPGPADTEPVT